MLNYNPTTIQKTEIYKSFRASTFAFKSLTPYCNHFEKTVTFWIFYRPSSKNLDRPVRFDVKRLQRLEQ